MTIMLTKLALLIAASSALLPLSSSLAAGESPPPPKKPNILLIITDDHAASALGVDGANPVALPNLNQLGKEGMVFDRSYCCNSICGPSRAAILTGRHSHMNGFVSNEWNRIDGSQPNYAKLLKNAGYQTAYFGKWHMGSDPVGFDTWNIVPNQGEYYDPVFYGNKFPRSRIQGYATDIITDMSLNWLKNRDKSQPFMMVVGHKAPHRSWIPAPRHIGAIDGTRLQIPSTLFDDYSNRPQAIKDTEMNILHHMNWSSDLKILWDKVPDDIKQQLARMNSGGAPWKAAGVDKMDAATLAKYNEFYGKRTRELVEGMQPGGKLHDPNAMLEFKWRCYLEDYFATLLAVDDSIGQIMKYLDNEKIAENTLVIYCGDQSFYLGEHGWYDKRWAVEESLRMPLVMRWKGKIAPGSVCEELVQNIDYAPTFAEVAGVKDTKDYGFQGTSLTPLMFNKGKTPNWRDALYYAFYEWPAEHNVARHDAIRTKRFTLIHLPRTDEWILFDTLKEPEQMRNLIDDPAYAEDVKSLKQEYFKLRKLYRVPDNLPGAGKEKLRDLKPAW